jgi:hypothetical protein
MSDPKLEALDKDECLALLSGAKYGRVAVVTSDGRPEILPVNYVVRNGTVVFVTGSAVLQARAPLGHIAFEVDLVDPMSHEGWDVVVSGEGAEITDAVDSSSLLARSDRVEEWAPGKKEHWMSIISPRFSGRRLYVPAPAPTFY